MSVTSWEEVSFREELEELINKHSIENRSNTPDYILADYLMRCLKAYENAINAWVKFGSES